MKRWQWATVAVFAGLVALEALVFAQPIPNNCGVNMLCRVRTLFVSGDATFSGDAGFAGSMSMGGPLAVPTVIANVVDGGTGVFTGPLTVTGVVAPLASLTNTGTAATCSGNTGAVCVDDTGGLAVANGGTTTATISAAGKATVATVAITANTDLVTGTLDVTGGATATVRSGAKCVACWDLTSGSALTCTVSGTTLTLSAGSNGDSFAAFCPTVS